MGPPQTSEQQKLIAENRYLKKVAESEAAILTDHFPKFVKSAVTLNFEDVSKEGYKIAEEVTDFVHLLARRKAYLARELSSVQESSRKGKRSFRASSRSQV